MRGYEREKNGKLTAGLVILLILVLFLDPPMIFTFQSLQIAVHAFCPSFIVQWKIKESMCLLLCYQTGILPNVFVLTFYFDIILASQEVVKKGQRGPERSCVPFT